MWERCVHIYPKHERRRDREGGWKRGNTTRRKAKNLNESNRKKQEKDRKTKKEHKQSTNKLRIDVIKVFVFTLPIYAKIRKFVVPSSGVAGSPPSGGRCSLIRLMPEGCDHLSQLLSYQLDGEKIIYTLSWLPSLKLTAKAPESLDGWKTIVSFSGLGLFSRGFCC